MCLTLYLVICAATGRARSTVGILFQKYVYSNFMVKIVLNFIHIWSVDLFLVQDDTRKSFCQNAAIRGKSH